MGKQNNVLRHYFRDKRRFADVFNGVFCRGRQIIKPEYLSDASEVYAESEAEKPATGEKTELLERIRDLKMKLKDNGTLQLLAVENQDYIDYTMPFRCMQYDAMEYSSQLHDLRRKNKQKGLLENWAERACGIKKTDRLAPIYTLCIYYGEELWDGPRTLRDMMNFGKNPEGLSQFFADYPMRLLCLNEETDFSVFHTEIRQLFRVLPYRKDKKGLQEFLEANEEYRHIDSDTLEVIAFMLNAQDLWDNREKYLAEEKREGKYDMCQALRELREDGIQEGIQQGIRQGIAILIRTCQSLGVSREITLQKLRESYEMDDETAASNMQEYWK